jgi:hypothetical protein
MGAGVKASDTSRDPSAVTSVIRHTIRAASESRNTVPFLGFPGVSNPLISAMIVGLLTYHAALLTHGRDTAISLNR